MHNQGAEGEAATSLPVISVVIPTHRRPGLLRRCLRALFRQDYPRDRFEIIVVEDGGPNGAERVVAQLRATGGPVELHCLWIPPKGPAAARNVGWSIARGEIIAFTDDDAVPHPRWLAEAMRSFTLGADAVSGRTIVPIPRRPTDYERNVKRLEQAPFITCNAFCRRELLEALGGFDTQFTRAYREDSDLQFASLELGARVIRNPDAIVYHPPRAAAPFVSLKQQRNQFFDALLYRKHPANFRKFISPRPPWLYYATSLALTTSLVASIGGEWGLAALAGGLWGALTGWFFVRRLRGTCLSAGHIAEMVITSLLIPPVAIYWRLRGAWAFRVLFL